MPTEQQPFNPAESEENMKKPPKKGTPPPPHTEIAPGNPTPGIEPDQMPTKPSEEESY